MSKERMTDEWIKETQGLIEDAKAERRILDTKILKSKELLNHLDERIKYWSELVKDYEARQAS